MPTADIVQSVLAPAGAPAAAIERLWWLMFWVCTATFAIVIAFIAVAVVRTRGKAPGSPAAHDPRSDRWLAIPVSSAVGATVVILIGFLVAAVWTGRTAISLNASSAISIAITGHQWWWEIQYDDAVPMRQVVTANEIHIPTNRPVVLKVTSADVIHSFWAPNLQGKRDLIPGYTTAIWIEADRPGTFRGQCAEFCGLQHAHMAFTVTAEPERDFERWLDAMRQPAPPPQSEAERHGQQVFMTMRCAGCHNVQGTDAYGRVGPDLTHVASRSTIGAGTLPNTRDHLAAWVRDPQSPKPGNQMPPNPLSNEDRDALIAYLQTLK